MGRRARREITEAELDELLAHSPRADLAAPALTVEVVEETLKALTEVEERQREELEASVEQAFYVAGAALKKLRERRLYRSTHPTFESYCRERFGHSRQKAHFLIAAAGIYQHLSTSRTVFIFDNQIGMGNVINCLVNEHGIHSIAGVGYILKSR
jgi:hypothetical protein